VPDENAVATPAASTGTNRRDAIARPNVDESDRFPLHSRIVFPLDPLRLGREDDERDARG